jgi:hypothetical protein
MVPVTEEPRHVGRVGVQRRLGPLSILGFALHFLFSPWLLVVIAIVAWIRFRPRRTGR